LQIPAYVSLKKLQEAGVDPDGKITCDFPVARADVQLARILDLLELTFIIRNEALVVTTPEDAESHLLTRVYDVRSLHETGVSLFDNRDYDTLIRLITSHVKPDSWDDVGGPGAIDLFRDLLIVSQTQPVHEQIEFFLSELRRAALWRQRPEVMPATQPSAGERRILTALEREIALDYDGLPLKEVCADLSRRLETLVYPHPVQLRYDYFQGTPVTFLGTPVTCHFPAAKAQLQLKRLCDLLTLGIDIRNDLLTVGLPEQVVSFTTRIYDVRSLVQNRKFVPRDEVAPSAQGLAVDDTGGLLEVLKRHVAPDSWSQVGGPGEISCVASVLVVTQSWQEQQAMETLLEELRRKEVVR